MDSLFNPSLYIEDFFDMNADSFNPNRQMPPRDMPPTDESSEYESEEEEEEEQTDHGAKSDVNNNRSKADKLELKTKSEEPDEDASIEISKKLEQI